MDTGGDQVNSAAVNPDIAALTELLKLQINAAETRERNLSQLVHQTLQTLSGTTQPSTTQSSPAPKAVAAERPMLLSSSSLTDFTSWEEAWDDFSVCQHLTSQPQLTQVSALRQAFDEDLRRFLREGIIPIPANANVAQIISAVKLYIRRQRNPILDRLEFYKRCQSPSEPFDAFYTALRELFNACDFPDLSLCTTCSGRVCRPCTATLTKVSNDVLRDRLVVGVRSDETRHKLLATQDLTLDSAVKLCRAEEAASQTSSSMPMTGTVNVARKTNYQRQKSHQPAQTPTNTWQEKCPNCGRSKHTKSPCPAAKVVCNVL